MSVATNASLWAAQVIWICASRRADRRPRLTTAIALSLALAEEGTGRHFPICGSGRRVACVVDGVTFWLDRVKYRVADIDAPEVSNPRCGAEARLANAAIARLAQMLNAGAFRLDRRGMDRDGRTLAVVSRSGQSFGLRLVREGLARKWGDRRGWC